MTGELLLAPVGCDGCGPDAARSTLLAVVDGRRLCLPCWLGAGRPWPTSVASPLEAHEVEVRTRERMTARGGTDRHLVRKGLT